MKNLKKLQITLMSKLKKSELSYKKIGILALVVIVIIVVLTIILSHGDSNKKQAATSDSYIEATIIKVVDGDTIWVKYDGYKKKVRFIGIDSPELEFYNNSGADSQGQQALNYTSGILTAGRKVYLQKDVSDVDDYDRQLRYIWLNKPSDNKNDDEIRSNMVNAMIILNGYAEAKEYAPDTKYSKKFSKYESEAKENQIGIWASQQ